MLVLLVAGALTAFPYTTALAADLLPYRIAVLGPPPLFSDPNLLQQQAATPDLSRQRLNREIVDVLMGDPRFAVVDEEAIQRADFQRIQDPQNQVVIRMADMYRLNGMEEFGRYNLDTAIQYLWDAIGYYEASGSLRANPRDVATAYEFLARAFVERAQVHPDQAIESRTSARLAFREMIGLNPNAVIDPSRYPSEVVAIFRDAYFELMQEDGRAIDMSPTMVEALATEHDLDFIVFTYFLRNAQGIKMVLQFANPRNTAFSSRQVITLTSNTGSSLKRLNRTVSRFMACIPVRYHTIPPPTSQDAGRFRIQAGWASTLYGQKPTERTFLNQGISLSLSYHFTDVLAVVGRTNVLFGERDPDGNLLAGFTSFRTALGLILSYRFDWLRAYLSLGIEGNRVGSFRATDDFWCKVTGGQYITYEPGRDCLAHEITIQPATFLVGPQILGGVSFDVARPFSLFLAADFAYYLTDTSGNLGFPFGAEAGIEYRF